jgi:hypothetical protein
MRVQNLTSERSGRPVANQFILTDEQGNTFFQSYRSIIAVRRADGSVELDEDYWDYSVTTGKYRNQFLNERKADTQRKIDAGIYRLTHLN